MTSASIIINSKSTRNETLADDLLHVSKRHADIRPYVIDGIDGLDRALHEIERNASDTLILCGGDGTMQAAITSAINHKRNFGLSANYVALPCGMTNVIANDCGLKGSPTTSLDNFLWRRGRGEVNRVERPLISMQLSDRQLPIYGFFLGAGLFHSAVQFSRDRVQKIGARRSLAVGISAVSYVLKTSLDDGTNTVPLPAQIRCENDELEDAPLSAIMMTTLTKLSAGIFPFWGEGTSPLQITSIAYPRKRFLEATLNVVSGRAPQWLAEYGYLSWRANELRLRIDAPVVFDGEIYHVNPQDDLILSASEKAAFLI